MQVEFVRGLNRRQVIALGGAMAVTSASLRARRARADLPAMQAKVDAILGGRSAGEGRIDLDLPEIAENGATVPVTVEVESPMTAGDHVRAVHILTERNPEPEVATFHFSPRNGRALVSTRIRLAESQRIHAVAEMSDGRVFMVAREVEVTIGGCGG